ncbi:MAG: DUF6531 domain-containing protein, partial [bacterium]
TNLSGATLTVTNGQSMSFPAVRTLDDVNLYASGGSVLSFPVATIYTHNDCGTRTIQASGAGSRIDLSNLGTLSSSCGTVNIQALAGGEVDLPPNVEGSTSWTFDAGSVFNVSAVTNLSGATLTVTNGQSMSFTSLTTLVDVTLNANGGTLGFPAVRTLSQVSLYASSGSVIAFPAATTYLNNWWMTIQATGAGSRIDLSNLSGLMGDQQDFAGARLKIQALDGGEIDLPPNIFGYTTWTLDDTGGILNVAAVTNLSGVTLNVSGGRTLSFPAVRTLSQVSLYASGGSVIAFPAATTYLNNWWMTIQATGAGSRIDLSNLSGLMGDQQDFAGARLKIQALAGGEIDLPPNIFGYTTWTLDGASSVFNLEKVAQISGATLLSTNGAAFTFPPASHITWSGANSIRATGTNSFIFNHGTMAAASNGASLTIYATNVLNTGGIELANGTRLDIKGSLTMDTSGALASQSSGMLTVSNNLLGSTINANQYAPQGTVLMNGSGTLLAPQLLEAMGQDLGTNSMGFTRNFAYGTLALSGNTYVKLIDLSNNAAGAGNEALYVNSLVVPAGAILDLNGLHLYTRGTQISGNITNGTVVQIFGTGPVGLATPTPSGITLPGQLDEWTFFGRSGRSMTVVVNPGGSGSPTPSAPYLDWAQVQLFDPAANALAMATNASAGEVVALTNVVLSADGTYRVLVRAPPGHSASTGNYVVTVWDVTPDVSSLVLNQQVSGRIENPYSVDRWEFSAVAGQQVRFDLVNASGPGIAFDLAGPSAWTGFADITGDSALVTLPFSGGYTLTAHGTGGDQDRTYAFRMAETAQTNLQSGATYTGHLAGSGQAQLFLMTVTNSTPMRILLNNGGAGNQTEIYVSRGAPPTRAEFDFRSGSPFTSSAEVLIPLATPGTLYVLVYGDYIPTPGDYTLIALTSEVILSAVTPSRHANSADAVLTLTGAGFDPGTTVHLVSTNSSVYDASAVGVDSFTQITARFASNSVPAGVYAVRVAGPGSSAQLDNAFEMLPGGAPKLETNLILPDGFGYHMPATIYVEYRNSGTAAMPAPLLRLLVTQNGQEGAFLTLKSTRLSEGFWTSAMPEGFTHSVQFLAGGETPAVLQPGDFVRVPIYYAGWQQPWDFSYPPLDFNLRVTTANDTNTADWASLKNAWRPDSITSEAWDPIWDNFTTEVGTTWGNYVRMLDDNAAYLGRLGQRVLDVGDLLNFEFFQVEGFSPLRSLASAVDADVPAPGMRLEFTRSFPQPIWKRFDIGPLGRGWSHNWQYSLAVAADGTVTVRGPGGSFRKFQPD